MRRLLLTARTAVRLTPRQLLGRLRRLAREGRPDPEPRRPPSDPTLHDALPGLGVELIERLGWPEYEAERVRAEKLRDGVLHAVGFELPAEEIDWVARHHSHLFTYHLHYFDEAPFLARAAVDGDRVADARLSSMWDGWLDACEGGAGDGWDPYPTSRRIPNWLRAVAILEAGADPGAPPASHGRIPRVLRSLWSQAERLRGSLEYDLDGNHLLLERAALVWASSALAPAPLRSGPAVDALRGDVERQLLPDGMHVERTPAYHLQLLEALLETIQLLDRVAAADADGLRDRAARMVPPLRRFVRDDGGLHPLGDTTPHGLPTAGAVLRLASHALRRSGAGAEPSEPAGDTPDPPWHLPDGGFAGYRDGTVDLVFDCGPFGAHHQPGHGHCDGLSLVLSVRGTPVIVDPGVAGYADDPDRFWARSTEAHNTIQVDGLEQTEIWDSFRAARRAVPGPSGVEREGDVVRLYGSIRPYHARGCVHERELVILPGELRVADRVTGCRGRRVDTRLHLAPGAEVRRVDDLRWEIRVGPVTRSIEISGVDEAVWTDGLVFPEWGRRVRAPVLHGWIDRVPGEEACLGFRIRYGDSDG